MNLVYLKKFLLLLLIILIMSINCNTAQKSLNIGNVSRNANVEPIINSNIYEENLNRLAETINTNNFSNSNFKIYIDTVKNLYYDKKDFQNTIYKLAIIENSISLQFTKKKVDNFLYSNYLTLLILANYYSQKIYDAIILIEKYKPILSTTPKNQKIVEDIKNELRKEISFNEFNSGDFLIYYNNRINFDYINSTSEFLSIGVNELRKRFNLQPEYKITVILYLADDYYNFSFIPYWSAAIYDGKIRIPIFENHSKSALKSTVIHELTHALQFQYTNGSKTPLWFAEGLAKYIEYSVLSINSNLKVSNFIDFQKIDETIKNPNATAEQINDAYTIAFMLIKKIIDNYGEIAVKNIIDNLKRFSDFDTSLKREIFINSNELFDKFEYLIKKELNVIN